MLLRSIAAIILTLILLFNLCGYRLIISALQTKADIKLEAAIDQKEYSEADLVELRVPMNMPYQQRYTDFERHYGEITINGKAYTYVERKIDGDMLILKVIANKSRQQLKSTADDLTKSNCGQDQESNGKKTHSFAKVFSGDYDDNNQFCSLFIDAKVMRSLRAQASTSWNDVITNTPHQPPRC